MNVNQIMISSEERYSSVNGTETSEFIDKVVINAVLVSPAYGLDTSNDANVQKILNETFSLK